MKKPGGGGYTRPIPQMRQFRFIGTSSMARESLSKEAATILDVSHPSDTNSL